ncbi:MAG TPA: hypothetical protein VL358_04485 [Caulobacteraceae bacterium]|jgi:hypothetical protein|nr:hypothetical protein [Caulobacteraceae bacterium]
MDFGKLGDSVVKMLGAAVKEPDKVKAVIATIPDRVKQADDLLDGVPGSAKRQAVIATIKEDLNDIAGLAETVVSAWPLIQAVLSAATTMFVTLVRAGVFKL